MTAVFFGILLSLSSYGALRLVNHTETLSLDHRLVGGLATALGAASIVLLQVDTIWSLTLLTILSAIAVTDLLTNLLPDWLMALFIGLGLAQVGMPFLSVVGVALCVLCALANVALTDDEGMIGTADYLLCAGLVAWLGPQYALDALIIALFVFGLQIIITRQRFAAFGPAIAIGLSTIWFGGPIL